MREETQQTVKATTPASLGDIESAGSRHMWRRSSVHVDGHVFVGRWDGTVTAFAFDRDRGSLETVWERPHPERAVALATCGGGDSSSNSNTLVVGGRGDRGTIVAYDRATGEKRWRYETSADLGEATTDRLFELSYVVALETDGESVYAAARRYERDGEDRRWRSVVYAFDGDGTVRWRYAADASPIALSLSLSSGDGEAADDEAGAEHERLAIGYNRCSGVHDNGLVVLEAESGTPAWTWDPGTAGERRVGDVAFAGDRLAVASHGDKCGYLLGPGGEERRRVPLAAETEIGDETLYAYPNHAIAADDVVAFATGNTYALEGRETENRHPDEHRLVAFSLSELDVNSNSRGCECEREREHARKGELGSDPDRDSDDDPTTDGDELWNAALEGFAHGLAASADGFAVPCAQNFRVRDPESHALRWIDRETGTGTEVALEGIATAAATDGELLATIEEPVRYHDDGTTRGSYAVHVLELSEF